MGKRIWAAIGIFIAIILVVSACNYVTAWGNKAGEVVSPDNFEKQYAVVISKYEGLIAASENACDVQTAGVAKGTSRSSTIVEDPTVAYASTYRRIAQEYNSAVDNYFEAALVGPPGYPTATEVTALDTSDWCMVKGELVALRG